LRCVANVRLDNDVGRFTGLRDGYELLSHGAAAPTSEVEAARAELANEPDSIEARWRLLSCLPYAAGPEASSVLRDGVRRQPDEFVDELLFHFPEKAPIEILQMARANAGPGRLFVISDAYATQGRPVEALEALRAALAETNVTSDPILRMAFRPVFSLQAHAQVDSAAQALALLKSRMDPRAPDGQADGSPTAIGLRSADELDKVGSWFPLDLRQVAARAVKSGDFENAPYEARFATRLMKPREVRKLNERLAQDAPTLSKILGLALTEEQLRPTGTPSFRIPFGWGSVIVTVFLQLTWFVHIMEGGPPSDTADPDWAPFLESLRDTVKQDCADAWSDACFQWDDEATRLNHVRNRGTEGPHPQQDPAFDPPMAGRGLP
jgi:hypothetical protein